MDPDTEPLISTNDLQTNVKTFNIGGNVVDERDSRIRKAWFEYNIRPILKEEFDSIDFVTLSKNGISNVIFYKLKNGCEGMGSYEGFFWNCICCCCCVDVSAFCFGVICNNDEEYPVCCGCCGNIIERYFPFLFKIFLKKDTCYVKTAHGLRGIEILDVVESVLGELIQESKLHLEIKRQDESILIKMINK